MLSSIIKTVVKNDFKDLKGSKLHLKIPFTKDLINLLFRELSNRHENIEHIEVKEINEYGIRLMVTIVAGSIAGKKFEIVDREITIKIYPHLSAPDLMLKIEILDGVGRFANEVLEVLFNTAMETEKVDFENKFFYIRHKEFSKNQAYQSFLGNIEHAKILTMKNKLLYDIQLNFK